MSQQEHTEKDVKETNVNNTNTQSNSEAQKPEQGIIDSITNTVGDVWTSIMGPSITESNIKFFTEEFGENVLDKDFQKVKTEELLKQPNYVAIYFGASQGKDSEKYQKTLLKTYNNIINKGLKLVVIFVSSDKLETDHKNNMANLPWYTFEHTDWKRKIGLVKKYNAKTIPHFVLLDPAGTLLTEDKRWPFADRTGDRFPWSGDSASCSIF